MKRLIIPLFVVLLLAIQGRAAHTTIIQLGSATATGVIGSWDLLGQSGVVAHKHTLQVTVTGAPASCSIELDGTLDIPYSANPTWANLSGTQTCTTSITFHVADKPVRGIRANLTALTGGTSPTVTAEYVGVE